MAHQWIEDNFGWFVPFFFIGMWIALGFLISLSGWAALARKYPAPVRPPGKSLRVIRARVGLASSYGNVIAAIPTEEGLYLSVCFLFRLFHPPMSIPWTSVTVVGRVKTWFWEYWEVQVKDPAGEMYLRFSDNAERALSAHAPAPARS